MRLPLSGSGSISGLAVLAGAVLSLPAFAASYVLVSDPDLVDRAPAAAVVRVVGVGPGASTDLPSTLYEVEVERLLKGHLPGGRVTVRVPGGVTPEGLGWKVEGAPGFDRGERALLLLSPRSDGTWGLVDLMLGAFHERRIAGEHLAVRDLSRGRELPAGSAQPEPPGTERDFSAFAAWIADRARGVESPPAYRVRLPDSALRQLGAGFRLFDDRGQCRDGQTLNLRWFRFDSGASVRWRARAGGVAGMPGGGFAELLRALDAWADDPGSEIRFHYLGTTPDPEVPDDADAVALFEDPGDQIDGSFDCASGGVLALGGPFFDCNALEHKGLLFREATQAMIITQDGAGCFFSGATGKDGEEVFAHELGHTLGLDHSNVPGALMEAFAHGDGRGAELSSDERNAVAFLYGTAPAGGSEEALAAPSELTGAPVSDSEIRLSWRDNSSAEESFEVQMRSAGARFESLGTVPPGSTTARVIRLAPDTTYGFRVRACTPAVCGPFTPEVTATTLPPQVPAAPGDLVAQAASDTHVSLSWSDNSSNEQLFRIESRADGEIGFREIALIGADATGRLVGPLTPGTTHTFRVRACNLAGCSTYSNPAVARTGDISGGPPAPAPSCSSDPRDLCLAGGRFRVEATWSNQRAGGQSGSGTAVPDTDSSGFFWFFEPENFELVVKILDGRTVNGHFWFFYGGLSDLEVTLTVTDGETGLKRTYRKEPGDLCGEADTLAFPDAGLTPGATTASPSFGAPRGRAPTSGPDRVGWLAGAAGSCRQSGRTLCLLEGRFAVTVDWADPRRPGNRGQGTAVPRTDKSGTFWFFDPGNVELVVKMLDARSVNGRFWLFYGALSDVEYEIRVEDTVTGAARTYRNSPGRICGQGDIQAF